MDQKLKVKDELKVWIYYEAIKVAEDNNISVTYSDINSVLIDILHENSKHDPGEQFKKTV